MAETKKIIHIEATSLSSGLDNKQLGVLSDNDPDLGYRMWGGKDGAGTTTKWLAKDRDARVTDLRVTGLAGGSGIVQHNANGDLYPSASLTQLSDVVVSTPLDGQVLMYVDAQNRWENATINLVPSLDHCYNNDSGERSITVDAGNVHWYLAATAAQHIVNITVSADQDAGFYVNDHLGRYFKIFRRNEEAVLHFDVDSSGANYHLGANTFQVTASGSVSITGNTLVASADGVCNVGSTDSTSDLNLIGRNTSITLNDASNLTLVGGFSATSIIGALNELLAVINSYHGA